MKYCLCSRLFRVVLAGAWFTLGAWGLLISCSSPQKNKAPICFASTDCTPGQQCQNSVCAFILKGTLPPTPEFRDDNSPPTEPPKPEAPVDSPPPEPPSPEEHSPDSGPDQPLPDNTCSNAPGKICGKQQDFWVANLVGGSRARHGFTNGEFFLSSKGETHYKLEAFGTQANCEKHVLLLTPSTKIPSEPIAATYKCEKDDYIIRMYRYSKLFSKKTSMRLPFHAIKPTSGVWGAVQCQNSKCSIDTQRTQTFPRFFRDRGNGLFQFQYSGYCTSQSSPVFATIYGQSDPGYVSANSDEKGNCFVQTYNKKFKPTPVPFVFWIPPEKQAVAWAAINKNGSFDRLYNFGDSSNPWTTQVKKDVLRHEYIRILFPKLSNNNAVVLGARRRVASQGTPLPTGFGMETGSTTTKKELKVRTYGGNNGSWKRSIREFFVVSVQAP